MPVVVDYKTLVQDDRIHASLYTDPRVFADEMDGIFTRGWVFVGHASEIPRPGDWVTRTIGREPVVMVRGRDGAVTVLVNRCMHRGTMLCQGDRGVTGRALTCPYHGWSYDLDGTLLGVPYPGGYAGLPRGDDAGVSHEDRDAVTAFLYEEARLADEARYGEWLALWTDDGVYWVPATTDPGADPQGHLSHIYDNRARLETRIKLLQTGVRYSQGPPSSMRRLISNVEIAPTEGGDIVVGANFILGELRVQAKHEMHWWIGRTTHRLRRVDGALRMARETVVLVNAAEPLPNLTFLI